MPRTTLRKSNIETDFREGSTVLSNYKRPCNLPYAIAAQNTSMNSLKEQVYISDFIECQPHTLDLKTFNQKTARRELMPLPRAASSLTIASRA